jgi:hypothetical protein
MSQRPVPGMDRFPLQRGHNPFRNLAQLLYKLKPLYSQEKRRNEAVAEHDALRMSRGFNIDLSDPRSIAKFRSMASLGNLELKTPSSLAATFPDTKSC